jgi:hypothetical protein
MKIMIIKDTGTADSAEIMLDFRSQGLHSAFVIGQLSMRLFILRRRFTLIADVCLIGNV